MSISPTVLENIETMDNMDIIVDAMIVTIQRSGMNRAVTLQRALRQILQAHADKLDPRFIRRCEHKVDEAIAQYLMKDPEFKSDY